MPTNVTKLLPDRVRLGVVCDLLEENWPSMELAATTIAGAIADFAPEWEIVSLRPALRRRWSPTTTNAGLRFNADRVYNRFRDYPQWLRRQTDGFDLFHLADHSYAQLVHELPAQRTVVTCHDIDTFRCLWEKSPSRPSLSSTLYRYLTRRTLSGLQKAARVVCVSQQTAHELQTHKLVASEKLRLIPNPVHPAFLQIPSLNAQAEAAKWLGPVARDIAEPFLLYVGSHIPRKRLDVLLRVVAEVRRQQPRVRLVRVGGALPAQYDKLMRELNLQDAITVLPTLEREVLVVVYQRAALTLLPSEREGFGWPVAESLACGTPVVASDLHVLREVGGAVTEYAPVADVLAWAQLIGRMLEQRQHQAAAWQRRCEIARNYAKRFSCETYAQNLWALYQELLPT